MSIRLLEHIRDELRGSGAVQNTPEFCTSWLGRSEGYIREYPRLCVWVLAHAIKTGHLLNRSGYRIANWFRAATHSLTQRPFFSKLRMAR